MQDVVGRLESVCKRLESAVAKMGGAEVDEDGVPAYVSVYDAIVAKELAALIAACGTLKIKACGTQVRKCFENVGALIAVVHKTAKPANPDMMTFLKDASAAIEKAETLKRKRDKRNKPDMGNYRAAMYEVCTMNTWVLMSPPAGLPATYVKSQIESAQFHLNRVLKDAKGKENESVTKDFVAAAKNLGLALHGFVKDNFKTGLEWKAGGGDLLSAPTSVAKKKTPVKAVESKEDVKEEKKEDKPAANMGNVFGELSKGLNITKGLKAVKKSQKTKYRKKEEGRGVVKIVKKKKTTKPKKTPSTKKQGFRWLFSNYYEGIIDVPDAIDMKANVFLSNCSDCQIEVKNKVKAISIESCKKMFIFINDVVSSVEMVRCDTVTIYCKGIAPNIQIDKCDSPRVVVLQGAANPDLIVSCVTAGNVEVCKPTDDDPDNMVSYPMPEQFKLQVTGNNDALTCEQIAHG